MEQKRSTQRAAAKPAGAAGVDTTESGPARLYAPGKPREVEAGPARLTFVPGSHQQASTVRAPVSPLHETGEPVDATEAGPARIVRYRR